MTPEEIAESRRICEAATEGPWAAHPDGAHPEKLVVWSKMPLDVCTVEPHMTHDKPNATFITHARTALPKALDEIERLRKYVRQLEHDAKEDAHAAHDEGYWRAKEEIDASF